MKALEGRGPLLPDVRLYHSAKKALRFMLGKEEGFEALEDADAQAWLRDGLAVVVMKYRGDPIEEYALLVHEAVHIVRLYYSETLMEENAGEEVYAYATQAVAAGLMRAHDRWRSRHGAKD